MAFPKDRRAISALTTSTNFWLLSFGANSGAGTIFTGCPRPTYWDAGPLKCTDLGLYIGKHKSGRFRPMLGSRTPKKQTKTKHNNKNKNKHKKLHLNTKQKNNKQNKHLNIGKR